MKIWNLNGLIKFVPTIFLLILVSCQSSPSGHSWETLCTLPASVWVTASGEMDSLSWFSDLLQEEELILDWSKLQTVRSLYQGSVKKEGLALMKLSAQKNDLLLLLELERTPKDYENRIQTTFTDANLQQYQSESGKITAVFANTDSTLYVSQWQHTLLLSTRSLAIEEAKLVMANAPVSSSANHQTTAYFDWSHWQELGLRDASGMDVRIGMQMQDNQLGTFTEAPPHACSASLDLSFLSMLPTFLPSFELGCFSGSLRLSANMKSWSANTILKAKGKNQDDILMLKVADPQVFASWQQEINRQAGIFSMENYGPFEVFQIPTPDIQWRGAPFLTAAFICIIDDFLLICESEASLKLYLDYLVINQVYSNNPKFVDGLKEGAAYLRFHQARLLRPWYRKYWEQYTEKSLQGLLFQFQADTSDEGLLIGHWHLPEGETEKGAPQIKWQYECDAEIRYAPIACKEGILALTETPEALLVSRTGHLVKRWRLPESVHQPLRLLNAERQLYFTLGQGTLFVLEARPPYAIQAFDLPFKEEVTASVITFIVGKPVVFLPSRHSADRLGENGTYAMYADGQFLEGWTPNFSEFPVDLPLRHIQKPLADYVFGWSQNGEVQIFSRNGSLKSKVELQTKFEQLPQIQEYKKLDRVVNIDTANYLYVVNLQGDYFRLLLSDLPQKAIDFVYEDLSGDARKEVIVSDGRNLQLYGYEGQRDFAMRQTYHFEQRVDTIFPKGKNLGALQRQRRKIYLFDESLRLQTGFPLEGTTPFEKMEYNGQTFIITGLDQQLVMYELVE